MKSYNIDENGFYGEFGGAFVPEVLYKCTEELRCSYRDILESDAFLFSSLFWCENFMY